jgi:hypothetical protein
MNNATDKKQLYNKVVYVYFCFFSMFAAQAYSMSVTYGAALFFSLSALFRISGFSLKTPFDPLWNRIVKIAVVVFFILSTVYIVLLYPFLFPYTHTAYAIAIIALPFVEREIEDHILRKRVKSKPLEKRHIAFIVLPVELIFIATVGAISAFTDAPIFVFAGMAAGMVFNFFRQIIYHDYSSEYKKISDISPDIRRVRSARLYYGMVITSGAALNIFAFTYILFILFSGIQNFLFNFFIVFGVISFIFVAIYMGTNRAVDSPLIRRIGKNAAFVLGTAVSIFAVYIFRDSWFTGTLDFSLQTILLFTGLILQMAAVLGLKEDIIMVLKLYDPNAEENALSERTARLEFWTAIISETVFLGVLLVIISNPLFYMMNLKDYIQYAPGVGSSVIAIPTVFLFIALIYSIKQPLNKKFGRRLKAYEDMRKQGGKNPDMETRLTNVLVKKYKKRIGVYIIRAFLKRIMYHTVTGKEHVRELPGVFVFNHGELYGPIAAVVFLPYDIRPWILDKMIDPKEIKGHMYEGTFGRIKWLPVFVKRLITMIFSPIVVWGLKSFDPIPVYRGSARGTVKTFKMSVECLNSGDSILLFPENPEERYGDSINSFYSGFADLGRMFYRKTGGRLLFYPVYTSKRSRTLRIGEGVRYDPAGGREERDKIVSALEESMRRLYDMDKGID